MNRIIFKSVEIIDPINNKYIKEDFIDGINLITSEQTGRGKSSLIRALYHSIGANAPYDRKFKASEKIYSNEFLSGENKYKIIRYKNSYYCYKNDELVKKVLTDYKELSKFFENEFNMSVYLTDRDSNFDIAPIAFSYIPYVLDQDKSWKSNDLPFNNMGQFLDSNRIDLYFFHLNVLNLQYYKNNKDRILIEQELLKYQNQISLVLEEIKTLKEYYNAKNIAINLNDAKVSLENMKIDLSKSLEENQFIQSKLLLVENRLIKLNLQKDEAQKILEELIKDKSNMLNTLIKCPSCNAEISLSNFDELRSSYSIEFLTENLKNINFDIEALNKDKILLKEQYLESTSSVEKIKNEYNSNNNLFEKYINLNAIEKMINAKEKDTVTIIDKINDLDDKITKLKLKLDSFNASKLICGSEFKDKYLENLTRLGVKNISKRDLFPFKKIILSGSQDPRSTLAFYFAFLQLKRTYNASNFLIPLVLDSPFEGDPDSYNKQDIVNDILAFYDFGEQLIIGMRNAEEYFENIEKPTKIIKLKNEKDSLLSSLKFKENIDHVNDVINLVKAERISN